MNLFDFTLLSAASLFVIVDPVAAVPAFLGMTEKSSPEERIRMARLAAWVTFFVLIGFSLGGQWIFKAFGITVPAFEIAGGVVLMKIALDMLQARRTPIKETPEEEAEGAAKEDIAITPLAIPMLAGPGAITAVTLLTSQAVTLPHRMVLILNIAIVSALTFFILRLAAVRSAGFSGITLKIITRLMGLLLAAIAVQYILNGIAQVKG